MTHKFAAKFMPVFLMVAIIASTLSINTAKATAALSSLTDDVTSNTLSAAANHTIKFVTPTGILASQTLLITLGGDAAFQASLDYTDVDFAIGSSNNCTNATFTEQTLAASPTTTVWGVVRTSSTVLTVTAGSTPTSSVGLCVRFLIGSNAVNQSTGVRKITNATTGTQYTVTIGGGTFGDTGTIAIPVSSSGTVTVTATVDPIIVFTVSGTSCAFGSLTTSVTHCSTPYTLAHNTNAKNGMSISVMSDGALRNTQYSIADVPLTTITAQAVSNGVEGYGFRLGLSGADVATANGSFTYATTDSRFPTTATVVITNPGPHASVTDTVAHNAAIASNGLTPAGYYTQVVTWTATGNF